MISQDKDWREILQPEAHVALKVEQQPGACSLNCQQAKEIKCVCSCHGQNHGAALKKQLKSLNEVIHGKDLDDVYRPLTRAYVNVVHDPKTESISPAEHAS